MRQVCHCHTRRFGTTTTNSMQIQWQCGGGHVGLGIPWIKGLYDMGRMAEMDIDEVVGDVREVV